MLEEQLRRINFFVHIFTLPFIIMFGIIGNILNIYILTRPAVRRTCSIYFLAGAINGLILLSFGSTSRWISNTFEEHDATRYSLFFCRFRNYIMNIIYNLAPYFIACVTIDRFCSSSINPSTRRWSANPKIAYKVLFIIILSTSISFSQVFFFYEIVDESCRLRSGFSTKFFPLFTTMYYLSAVFLIVAFGFGTIKNIRAQSKRIRTITNCVNRYDRRRAKNDAQVLMMLLIQVICYALFALPYHLTVIVAAIQPLYITNRTFTFLQQMGIIALNLNHAVSISQISKSLMRESFLIGIKK